MRVKIEDFLDINGKIYLWLTTDRRSHYENYQRIELRLITGRSQTSVPTA